MRKTDAFRFNPPRLTSYRRRGYFASADALTFLSSLRGDVADIVFLDPPFNLGKDYGIRSRIETADQITYGVYMEEILRESTRVLRPGGALFLYHVPFWASQLTAVLHDLLEFRHWIAVAMKSGFARGARLYPAHYALLYFTKGKPTSFTRPRLSPRTCRHCGRYVKDYGGYTAVIESNGVNLSDVWDDLSPVRHPHLKHRSANQLPQTLTDRIVAIAGRPGGLLVDPFVGSGTSLVSAIGQDMRFVANDLAPRNLTVSVKRLDTLSSPRRQGTPG